MSSEDHSFLHTTRRAIAHYSVEPITNVLVRLRIHPNVITFIGLAIGIGAGVLVAYGYFWQAGLVIIFGSVMDLFDGSVARKRGMVTLLGAFMDSIFDRLQEGAILVGLLIYFVYFDTDAPHQTGIILTFVAFWGSIMISYLRARAEGYDITGTSGIVTRTERVILVIIFLFIAGFTSTSPLWLVVALTIATAIGILTRSISIVRRIHRIEKEENSPSD